MSAEPITEPVMTHQDPIDLLIAIEKAVSPLPIRAEYIEGTTYVPPHANHQHNAGAFKLAVQLSSAGFTLAGMGNGYRAAHRDGRTTALVVPDFYVLRRDPGELDEAYRRAHKSWYPIDLLALVGEVTSSNHETDTGPKLRTYAAAGVPVYVLVNRHSGTAHCYTDPVPPGGDPADAYYGSDEKVDLGQRLPLPPPYPSLDTSAFLIP
ncbi:Uma2 family endonuclease [Streptomyces sp. NPDC004610]|uniref:Uma2 family endonuclease n=1 Tax=unclassified Streptomyces TaxID=2593676 RepID=UPI0033BB4EA9